MPGWWPSGVRGRTGLRGAALIRSGGVDDAYLLEIAAVLQIDPGAIVEARWIDNGPGWVGIMLASAEAVLAVDPVGKHHRRIDVGLVGLHEEGCAAAVEVRAFFTDHNLTVLEDPVTGSLNASVADWLYETGRMNGPYVAAQGTRLGRRGRVSIERDSDGRLWVGGRTRTQFAGSMASDVV